MNNIQVAWEDETKKLVFGTNQSIKLKILGSMTSQITGKFSNTNFLTLNCYSWQFLHFRMLQEQDLTASRHLVHNIQK